MPRTPGVELTRAAEPFVASAMFAQSKGGVYPHEPSKPFKPIEINLAWTSPLADSYMYSFAKRIQDRLNAAAVVRHRTAQAALTPHRRTASSWATSTATVRRGRPSQLTPQRRSRRHAAQPDLRRQRCARAGHRCRNRPEQGHVPRASGRSIRSDGAERRRLQVPALLIALSSM